MAAVASHHLQIHCLRGRRDPSTNSGKDHRSARFAPYHLSNAEDNSGT